MTFGVMDIRQSTEAMEDQWLNSLAARSAQSAGRVKPETHCHIRTAFQRDRDRILHSKAFRRLKHKTQMFIAPTGDHYRTRLTHTLEVSQVSRTIARALRLNEDLTESIALAHDLGHPPFGHTGEYILNELSPFGYHHQQQGLRVVTVLENLNLTREVLDGMEGLTEEKPQFLTLEAQIVDIADRMTYLHHDVEDARRAGIMRDEDLPQNVLGILGQTRQERLDRMVMDLVRTSLTTMESDQPLIALSPPIWDAMMTLRQWMFDHIYLAPQRMEQTDNVRRMLSALYKFYFKHPEALSENLPQDDPLERRVLDYISGMTDRFAIEAYQNFLLPQAYRAFSVNMFSGELSP
ncbi:deoxyguanosinetriphosphate triphosphohydrolase [Vampirovibrio sp.]|uniref:deoxyguanosinetriphosphate triphosphohydrolase n=1 Tax=Vampirovibrio sp. TaxID=2717857 RepID=UPI0035934820